MSITGINVTSAATRIAATGNGTGPTADSSAATRTPALDPAQVEEADNKPTPVHFPWLSRLSAGLEAASNKRAPFSTQIMGEKLNKQA